jgi:hypothetical protein
MPLISTDDNGRLTMPEDLTVPDFEDVIEGEAVDVDDQTEQQDYENNYARQAKIDAETPTEQQPELLLDDNGDVYQAVVDAKLSENIHAAKGALQNYCTTGYDTDEKAIAWMHLYRGWKDTEKTTPEAAELANAGEVPK